MMCGEPSFCDGCPVKDLETGDRLDAVNSIIILKSLWDSRSMRLDEWERQRVENTVRQEVGYSNKGVSRLAILAFEKQLGGQCKVKEGI